MARIPSPYRVISLALLPWMLFLGGCALGESGAELNDPIPSGSIVAQGSFTGIGNKSASGIAVIYKTSASAYVLRLSGVSFPQESGLQLILVVDSTNQTPMMLRSSSGTQNYSFQLAGSSPVFNQVRLYSVVTFTDYAIALFYPAS